jgi:drug/metabolite transporter (DMT)-like permease
MFTLMFRTSPAAVHHNTRTRMTESTAISDADASPLAPVRPGRIETISAFLAIYVIWGSTFLAIRYAVESIPPLFTAATRHLVAGSILLGWALWKGERPTRQGLRAGIVLGFLFFFVSHGLLHWAELNVPSGVAALVIAIEPAIVALLLPLLKLGPRPRGVTWAGLALGAASVALLFRPDVSSEPRVLTGLVAMLVSAIAWSIGIVYSRKLQPANGATLNAALPLMCGSLMLLAGGLVRGEHHALQLSHVLPESVVGLSFLIFFGSLTAFSAYAWLLKHYPPTLVATHTYVNPMVAVLLGWALAGEKLTGSIVLSMALAILAISLVNRGSRGQ